MGDVQSMSGRSVAAGVTLVVGEIVSLKFVGSAQDTLPARITINGPGIVAIDGVNTRAGHTYLTFKLRGGVEGKTRLAIAPSKGSAVTVGVTVEAALALPAENTDAGLLARLFLAEVDGPNGSSGSNLQEEQQSMALMRRVLANRLLKPSAQWGSAHARTLADVIHAPGQFHGFEQYPALPADISSNINNIVRIANTASDGRRRAMHAFLTVALRVAAAAPPADPSRNGLYWWRTKNKGKPSQATELFRTLGNNSFYQP